MSNLERERETLPGPDKAPVPVAVVLSPLPRSQFIITFTASPSLARVSKMEVVFMIICFLETHDLCVHVDWSCHTRFVSIDSLSSLVHVDYRFSYSLCFHFFICMVVFLFWSLSSCCVHFFICLSSFLVLGFIPCLHFLPPDFHFVEWSRYMFSVCITSVF